MRTEMTAGIRYIFIEPRVKTQEKSPVLLLLHGVGSNEKHLAELAQYFDPRFAILSLRAPLVLGSESFAWFHVNFTAQGPRHNSQEAEESRVLLKTFISELGHRSDLDASQIFILGFSQGAIMGLSLALTEPALISGVVAIAGRTLPEVAERAINTKVEREGVGNSAQVLLIHGRQDSKLPYAHALNSESVLKNVHASFDFKSYEADHQITAPMLQDIQLWFMQKLKS